MGGSRRDQGFSRLGLHMARAASASFLGFLSDPRRLYGVDGCLVSFIQAYVFASSHALYL